MAFEGDIVDARPRAPKVIPLAARLATIEGARVGLLFNHKPASQRIFELLGEILQQQYGAAGIEVLSTHANTTPTDPEVVAKFAENVDVVAVGIGDSGSPSLLTVHDAIQVERCNKPGIPICTVPFFRGDTAMAKMRGAAKMRVAVVSHPITGVLGEPGMKVRAEEAASQIVAIATGADCEIPPKNVTSYAAPN